MKDKGSKCNNMQCCRGYKTEEEVRINHKWQEKMFPVERW